MRARALLAGGLFLAMFALLALSGPGRLDVVDGHTRYAVARSLVDYGDSVVRDPDAHFAVFPGRNGDLYAYYRFPHSALGALAVLAADLTGIPREERRHFFFLLVGAGAGALLAVLYFFWFRREGHTGRSAIVWAVMGVLATPAWHYSTTTFDEILGTVTLVAALLLARAKPGSSGSAWTSGLLMGLAFNIKPPLAAFALPVFALHGWDVRQARSRRVLAAMTAGVALGVLAYVGYDLYKFPPGSKDAHVIPADHNPMWAESPVPALLMLAFSPAASIPLYFPAVVLTLAGLKHTSRDFRWAAAAALGTFTLFIASLGFFKGDLCWGPRYFTPAFGMLWLFAPAGSQELGRRASQLVVALSIAVQLVSLTVDPYRLYIEQACASNGVYYFNPAHAHLLNRPREIIEVWQARRDPGEQFTPSRLTTFEFARLPPGVEGPGIIRRYKILNAFRPWWATFQYVPPSQRPIDLAAGVATFSAIGVLGLLMLGWALRQNLRAPRGGQSSARMPQGPSESTQSVVRASNSPTSPPC